MLGAIVAIQTVEGVLQAVARRRAFGCWLRRCARAGAWLLAVAVLVVLVVRWFAPQASWLLHPAWLLTLGGVAIAALWRVGFGDLIGAARAVDLHLGSDDLFLSHLALRRRVGAEPQFATVVDADARARAAQVDPARVVPWRWPRAAWSLVAVAALFLLSVWLAPYGTAGQPLAPPKAPRPPLAKVEARIAALRKAEVQAPHAPEVTQALAELKRELQALKRETPPELKPLRATEAKLGELWRERKAAHNAQASSQSSLGASDRAKQDAWRKELAGGKVDAAKQELAELRQRAGEAMQKQDAEARQQAAAQARELRSFAQRSGARDLDQAMADVLAMLGGESGAEADAELDKLVDRADLELDAMRQAAADLAALEKAMEASQMGQALAEMGALPDAGEMAAALDDYAKQFAEMMAQQLDGLELCKDCDGGG